MKRSRSARGTSANQRCFLFCSRPRHSRTESAVTRLELAFDRSDAAQRLLPPLEIFAAAHRSGQVGLLLIGPGADDFVLHRSIDPRQRVAIKLLLGSKMLLQHVGALEQSGKAKGNRRGNGQDLAQHAMEFQRGFLQRLGLGQRLRDCRSRSSKRERLTSRAS